VDGLGKHLVCHRTLYAYTSRERPTH